MDTKWMLVIAADAVVGESESERKRLAQHLVPLHLPAGTAPGERKLLLKIRNKIGRIEVDASARMLWLNSGAHIKSEVLARELRASLNSGDFVAFEFEEAIDDVRAVIRVFDGTFFNELQDKYPEVRLYAYDLPPSTATRIDSPIMLESLSKEFRERDPELYGTHTEAFLAAPHILIPLFGHIMSLSGEDNLRFPTQLKKLADQFRVLLEDPNCKSVTLQHIARDHKGTWATQKGKRLAFLDGGMARIAGLPGTDPLALRVGIYGVVPGEQSVERREQWTLEPFVLGELTTPPPASAGGLLGLPNPKRLQEAARYVLEPLSALKYLRNVRDTSMLFLHGPLINQFTQYDEGEPNWIPCLREGFLAEHGLTRQVISDEVGPVPSINGISLWTQFMAVYGAITQRLMRHEVPLAGVVERTAGSWLAKEVLRSFVNDNLITEAYRRKVVDDIIDRYDISDDFLFGCVLRDGEYLSPSRLVGKNLPRRARQQWQDVVGQYAAPFASVLKTNDTSFPFRVELNAAAAGSIGMVMGVLYHTARLLPRYAFPVGLDIADKYAKIPDWISRGVSSRITAEVLRRALSTGDPHIVNQVRLFLARSPRDFFYRPKV